MRKYSDEWIDAKIEAWQEGDSNDDEIDGLTDIVRALQEERLQLRRARLEELRVELRAERTSYGELAELQSSAEYIDPSDVELLEAAGVAEFPADNPEIRLDELTKLRDEAAQPLRSWYQGEIDILRNGATRRPIFATVAEATSQSDMLESSGPDRWQVVEADGGWTLKLDRGDDGV